MRWILLFFLSVGTLVGQEAAKEYSQQYGTPNAALANQRFLLSGTIGAQATTTPLTGVTLWVPSQNIGSITDADGHFQLLLPYGTHIIEVAALGYVSQTIELKLYAAGVLDIYLEEGVEALEEVVVSKGANENLTSAMVGRARLSVLETKNIPMVLGEQNILKAATVLPGISTSGEASTGFNVRGGKADQNLMLLNKGIIINPTHFFGIFQALNPFVVEELNVYKGNIPIQYEGRTSAVFEMKTKAPSTDRMKGKASLGPITANAIIEAPIRKGKSGMMVGFRSAHSDWLLRALKDPKLQKSSASFYDGIATYDDQLSEDDQLSMTLYLSNDAFQISSDSLYQYANRMAAVNWRHRFNERNDMQFHASSSSYDFSITYDGSTLRNFRSDFKMDIHALRWQLNSQLFSKHQLTYGANAVFYGISPGDMQPLSPTDLIRPQSIDRERAIEGSIFIADQIELTDRLLINLGLQGALYGALGPYRERTYQENLPKSALTTLSETEIPENNLFARRFFPSYRLSGRYLVNDVISVKLAALRMYQFVHSLTNNTTASPIDTWRISTNNLAPQASDQLAFGVFFTPLNEAIEMSLEGFYKRQENLVDFKTGAQLFLNQFIETEVLQGKGKAYGVEFLLRKKKGKHTGWLGYTYARTLIQLESDFVEERVNNGAFFPTNYDKPHDLSVVWNYAFHRNFSFSANLMYQTGRPITIPNGNYTFNNAEYVLFSDRNQYRIPDYYRVDLGLTYDRAQKKQKSWETSWHLSVYNIFGRNNPFSVYFITEEGTIKGRRSAIFAVPIPSLTVNISF